MKYITLSNGVSMPMPGYGVYQVETHALCQQTAAHAIMEKYGVIHRSWGPLPRGGRASSPTPSWLL